MHALIQAVREAAQPFVAESNIPACTVPPRILENPMHRLVPPESLGIANGFLFGFATKQPAVREVIEQYGLYKSGLAALSMTEQGDSPEAVIVLLNMVHTLKAGRVGKRNSAAASQSRSPQRSFIKQIILDDLRNISTGQKDTHDLWRAAGRATAYTFDFNDRVFKCDARIEKNELCGSYCDANNEDANLEEFTPMTYEQFKNIVGKLKMEIRDGA